MSDGDGWDEEGDYDDEGNWVPKAQTEEQTAHDAEVEALMGNASPGVAESTPAQATASPAAQVSKGTVLRCVANDDQDFAEVYESTVSAEIINNVPRGETVTAAGEAVDVDGWPMVPIEPTGAVQLDLFEVQPTQVARAETRIAMNHTTPTLPNTQSTAAENAKSIRQSILAVRDAMNEVNRTAPPKPQASEVIPGKGIFVTIKQASGLRNDADGKKGSSDPFCTCEIVGKDDTKIGTGVVTDNPNPVWNHRQQIANYVEGDNLTFTVWDWDENSVQFRDGVIVATDQLGSCQLKFEEYYPNGCEKQLVLTDALAKPSPKLQVKVEIEGKPGPSPKAEKPKRAVQPPKLPPPPAVQPGVGIIVTIMNAAGLRNTADGKKGASDPFCTCEIARKESTKFCTNVIIDDPNPAWEHRQQIVDYTEGDALKFTVFDWDDNSVRIRDGIIIGTDQLGSCQLKFSEYYPSGCLKQLTMTDAFSKPEPILRVKVEIEGQPKFRKKKKKAEPPEVKPAPPIVDDKGILVTIISATGLRNADNDGLSDPFVTCSIPGKMASKFETGVIMDNLNPRWNHTRQIIEYAEDDPLKFVVWDWDGDATEQGASGKEMLGVCELKYSDYYPDGCEKHLMMQGVHKPFPTLYVKVEVSGRPALGADSLKKQQALKNQVDVKDTGEVKPAEPIVEGKGILVTIVRAHGLRNADADHGGLSDPFCSCEIPRKSKSSFESHVVIDTLNPVWNFTRQIVDYTEGDPLRFVVWDRDDKLGKDMLGKCELPFSQYHPSGGEHRLEMPSIHKPYPYLVVSVKILGEPKSKATSKAAAKGGQNTKLMFGRRVPKKDSQLSPRAQAREDARRVVLYMNAWSENLRQDDEFTDLIPSKKQRPQLVKKDDFGLTEEREIALDDFLQFLIRKGGNYPRAWRVLVDIEWHGRVTKIDLGTRCRAMGFKGNLKALWEVLDQKHNGFVTLADVDPESTDLLARFYCALESRRRVEEKQQLSWAAERGEPEPEHQPEEVGNNDGTRLMKIIDVDDTRKLTKGEFCCAVVVLQLAKQDDAPVLFSMLHHAEPSMACHNNPANATVTEKELQWLHNLCVPFNLFDKVNKRGKEGGTKHWVLSPSEKAEAQRALLTRGRLRKVWKQQPAVFGRLYEDAGRREDDFVHRFDEEVLKSQPVHPDEAKKASDRLYNDAYVRAALREMAEEDEWEQALLDAEKGLEGRQWDPDHISKLAQPHVRTFKGGYQGVDVAMAKPSPKRKVNMDHIERMIQNRKEQVEKNAALKEERIKKEEEQAKKDAKLATQPISAEDKKLRDRIWRKMRDAAYEEECARNKELGLAPPEKKPDALEPTWSRLQRDASGKSKKAAKQSRKDHPVGPDQADINAGHEDEKVFKDLIASMMPEAPLPLPRDAEDDGRASVSQVPGKDARYHFSTPFEKGVSPKTGRPRPKSAPTSSRKPHIPKAKQLNRSYVKALATDAELRKAGLIRAAGPDDSDDEGPKHKMPDFWWTKPDVKTRRKTVNPGMQEWSASEESSDGDLPDFGPEKNPLANAPKKSREGKYTAHTCFPSKEWRDHNHLHHAGQTELAVDDEDLADMFPDIPRKVNIKKAWDGPQRPFAPGKEPKAVTVHEVMNHVKQPAYPAKRKSVPPRQMGSAVPTPHPQPRSRGAASRVGRTQSQPSFRSTPRSNAESAIVMVSSR